MRETNATAITLEDISVYSRLYDTEIDARRLLVQVSPDERLSINKIGAQCQVSQMLNFLT